MSAPQPLAPSAGLAAPHCVRVHGPDFLSRCRTEDGGLSGGPQQMAHCAPTFSGVLALLVLGTPSAYAAVPRKALYSFFMAMKHPSGGFRMHDEG